jgi:hypothetical protein
MARLQERTGVLPSLGEVRALEDVTVSLMEKSVPPDLVGDASC